MLENRLLVASIREFISFGGITVGKQYKKLPLVRFHRGDVAFIARFTNVNILATVWALIIVDNVDSVDSCGLMWTLWTARIVID